jgi:hypothetical protein
VKINFRLGLSVILVSFAMLLLASGLRLYRQHGGPGSAYWVSEIFLGGLGASWGIILLTKVKNINGKSVSRLLGSLILVLIGIVIMIHTIRFINMSVLLPAVE